MLESVYGPIPCPVKDLYLEYGNLKTHKQPYYKTDKNKNWLFIKEDRYKGDMGVKRYSASLANQECNSNHDERLLRIC